MNTHVIDALPISIYTYDSTGAESATLRLPAIEVHDRELDEFVLMAYINFMGLRWEVGYWDTNEEHEVKQYAYFDTYEEAEEFMTVRLVLARML